MKIWIKICGESLFATAFALLFTWSVLASETNSTEVMIKQETTEAIQAIKSYSIEQRDRAVKEAKQVIEELDVRIQDIQDGLQKKWDRMDQAARKQANDTLKGLRAQRNNLSEWYGGLKYSSTSAWKHVKEGFVGGYEALSTAFDKAEKEFDSDADGKN